MSPFTVRKAGYLIILVILVIAVSACTNRANIPIQSQPVQPEPTPAGNVPAAPASEPAQVTNPAAPNPEPVIPVIPSPSPVPDNTPHPGPNEIWIVGNQFIPDFIAPSEGVTFSVINKNAYPVTILPSPSSANGAVYTDRVTGIITVNGYIFNSVLPPGSSMTLTLVTGGPFVIYLQSDPSVTATIRVGT